MARKTEKGGKFRNVHCRTWNMARKLKIMEKENCCAHSTGQEERRCYRILLHTFIQSYFFFLHISPLFLSPLFISLPCLYLPCLYLPCLYLPCLYLPCLYLSLVFISPLFLQRFYVPVQGNARARKQEWVGWGAEQREGVGDFWDSIWNVNEENV